MTFPRSILVLFALALAACQTPPPKPAPAPDPASVMAPATEVPDNVAAFSGIWTGTWGTALDGNLTVKEVRPDGSVTVTYAWGDHPRGRFEAGRTEHDGQVTGNKLVLDEFSNGAQASYTMRADGKLDGRYVVNGDVTLGLFEKM